MRIVTWILRFASIVTFAAMAFLVYSAMDVNDVWHWAAPYEFVVTVFRLLSLIFFFASIVLLSALVIVFTGANPGTLVTGLYNTLVLRMWYMQPYGVRGPLTNINQVMAQFQGDLERILLSLWDNAFLFLYFLCAGVSIALFLQSLFRMEHKYASGAFVSMQLILILAAFRGHLIPNFEVFPADFLVFLFHPVQILALISFAYLETSYQMIYSHSVGKPVEEREETLRKQLLALRQATRKVDAIERGDKVSLTAMSRSSGATAFSFLREAIERKVVGSKDALENLDAISDVRRLQNYVDDILTSDSRARDELTAKAASPSSGYIIGSTIMGSAIRFLSVVAVSFLLISPSVLTTILNLPIGIQNSVEILQPEMTLLLLVPIALLFPFAAMVITWFSKREVVEEPKLSKEEEEEQKRHKRRIEQLKKEAKEKRRAREKARKEAQKRREHGEEKDEWDKALEETYR
ncbi:MAG: hypothetical protein EAX81_06240 [Candidatus Thorarchaeota archaeon]|nr:hypothetical protein [Candidatus Thorarchaeota archaeon]